MKAFKTTFVIAVCALAIGACAKKDGNFASKNAMNASPINGKAVQDALNSGVKLDFFGINTVNKNADGITVPFQFRVLLMVNDLQTTVTTSQAGVNVANGQTSIGGYNVTVSSMCLDPQCVTFDIAATATAPNGQRYGQVAYKFFRQMPDSNSDVYMLFGASQVLPSFGNLNSIGDVSTVVGYLNQPPQ